MPVGTRAYFFEHVEASKDMTFDEGSLILRHNLMNRFL